MAEIDGPVTSDRLAAVMQTNPVVVRRLMGTMREAGFVTSEKGHGGGWSLACDFAHVTLRDIYVALGSPEMFSMGNRSEAPTCLVEQAVNAALASTFRDAEALVLSRLGEVTLERLSADFHAGLMRRALCGQEARNDVGH